MTVQFISTNKNYKRLYPEPLDPSISFNTEDELLNYLNDPTCYLNQIIGCKGKAYIVYEDNGVKKHKNVSQDYFDEIQKVLNEKFDDVELTENGILNFYANKILKKSIQLPTKFARAICGEFLCGELEVGYNTTQTFSAIDLSKPTVWVDNETPVNAFNLNTIENKILALKDLLSGYHMGTTPPSDTNLIWIDTTDDEFDNTIDSSILDELKATITAMQNKITKLEADVEYLKANGGGGVTPPVTVEYCILTEDGDSIICEDGDIVVLEEYSEVVIDANIILIEDGDYLTTEDNNTIILEGV